MIGEMVECPQCGRTVRLRKFSETVDRVSDAGRDVPRISSHKTLVSKVICILANAPWPPSLPEDTRE